MRHWAEEIGRAGTLEALRDILAEAGRHGIGLHPEAMDPDCRVDRGALPRFGGPPPLEGTVPIWSWDEERVLVGESCADLRLISRRTWREWMRKERE